MRTSLGIDAAVQRRGAINIFGDAIALTIGSLLPIMNPFSTAPLFVALSAGFDKHAANRQAMLACVYSFGILVSFLLLGAWIIDFFGISVPGIRVAGGLIIATVGFRMLFPPPPVAPAGGEGEARPQELNIAFTPLAMPSLSGPGSISVVLTAAGHVKGIYPEDWGIIYLGVIVGMAVTLIISYFVLRAARSMVRFLGTGGLDAMTRIFGFLLICIGMQFLLTGISDYFGLAHH